MTNYLGLYILVNIFCCVIISIIAIHSRFDMGYSASQRRFFVALMMIEIFFISDTVWYAMDCGAITQIYWFSILLKSIYFLSATIAGYVWFLYMGALTNTRAVFSFRNVAIFSLFVWMHLGLLIFNVREPILFGVDENFVYFRGPLFAIQYFFFYFYLLLASTNAVYQAFRHENYVDRPRFLIISSFPIPAAISGILQLFYWRIPFNCMAFTVGIIVVYLSELGQQVSQEPLTHLSNRLDLMRNIEQYVVGHEEDGKLYLFMADIDDFKNINDTYGHVEGDRAITNTAEALRRAVLSTHRKSTLARYGGDEFAIAIIFEEFTEVELLKYYIDMELAKVNNENEKDYKIALSMGMAQYDKNSHPSIKEFVHEADMELYKNKYKA